MIDPLQEALHWANQTFKLNRFEETYQLAARNLEPTILTRSWDPHLHAFFVQGLVRD